MLSNANGKESTETYSEDRAFGNKLHGKVITGAAAAMLAAKKE